MATFTESDLTAVQNAIVELAIGQRVQTIKFSHGETVEYGPANLQDLERLRGIIQNEINIAAGKASFFRTTSGKGL